jgi:hypothetical protein
MSQENVEVVRRACEFLERGELPLPGPYFGHEGVRQWWSDIVEVVPGFRLQLEEVIDVGDERVVGALRTFGTGLVEQLPSWRPSKPWGCRSSRCRRRTWRSFNALTRL